MQFFKDYSDLLPTALSAELLLHGQRSPGLIVVKTWKGVVFFFEKLNGFIITWLRCAE